MQIKDSKYHKVWKVEVNDHGFVKVKLGDSRKNKDGEYENWSWFNVNFVGNCKEKAKTLNEGDTITIDSGIIAKREYNGNYYDDITVFAYTITSESTSQPAPPSADIPDDDIPF